MPLLLKGTSIKIDSLRICKVFNCYRFVFDWTDMTFTHEGNRTLLDSAGLINFEKMHMLAQTMRTLRYCRSRQLRNFIFFNKLIWAVQKIADSQPVSLFIFLNFTVLQPPTPRSEQEVRNYIRNLRVIDNQRILTGLSQRLEPKRA
jgi:Rap guanine nucleotide exchange factor 4